MADDHARNPVNERTSLTRTSQKNKQTQTSDVIQLICDRIPHFGIFYAVLSALTYSLRSAMIQLLPDLDPILVSFWSIIGLLFLSAILMTFLKKHPYPKNYRILLTLRAVIGTLTHFAAFLAFRRLPLGDAMVIFTSTPIIVPLLGWMFLKEECGIFHLVIIVLGAIGINFIARPTFLFGSHGPPLSSVGLAFAFSGLVIRSSIYIFLRQLKDVHHSVIGFHNGLLTLFTSGTVSLATGTFEFPQEKRTILLSPGLMITQYLTQTLIVKALEIEKAGDVSIAHLIVIVFAFLWQYLIFHQPAFFLTIIGTVLVTVSIVLLPIIKTVDENVHNGFCRNIVCL